MPFIESNILMSLFRIARLLLLLFCLDLFEDQRRAKASFCGSTKAVVEEEEGEEVDNDGGYIVGLI